MREKHPDQESVCAVMVTHRIGVSVHVALDALMPQVQHVVVVDNASKDDTKEAVQAFATEHPGMVDLYERTENNLAAAQNEGIRRALELGYGWILLMDHDSIASEGMVATLLEVWRNYPHREKIGVLAPNLVDIHSHRTASYPQAEGKFRFHRRRFEDAPVLEHLLGVVASGSLIPASVFHGVGMMEEAFHIDYVDKEFCLRIVRAGYEILAVREAVLRHSLGDCRDHTLLGLPVTTTNHSAARRYSIYRNRMLCWRRHGWALPAFVLYDLCSVGYDLVRVLFFEQGKGIKLRAMMHGIVEGMHVDATPGNTPPLSRDQSR